MLKKGSLIKISGIGVGKIIRLCEKDDYNETGTIVIEITGQNYYREIDKDHNITDYLQDTFPATEKEYVKFLKDTIKQLAEMSSKKRKEAANYNKEVNGLATKRKGKVPVINGNIAGFWENNISSYHRKILNDAKELKKVKDQLKEELKLYK